MQDRNLDWKNNVGEREVKQKRSGTRPSQRMKLCKCEWSGVEVFYILMFACFVQLHWTFSHCVCITRHWCYKNAAWTVWFITETEHTIHMHTDVSAERGKELAGRGTHTEPAAQLVNNVKHPRQMVFGITYESTLLQLQIPTSSEPYFSVSW